MPYRDEELRKRASECIALARKARSTEVRTGLFTLARNLHQMADAEMPIVPALDHAVPPAPGEIDPALAAAQP